MTAALRPRLRDHPRRPDRIDRNDRLLHLQPGLPALPRGLRGRRRRTSSPLFLDPPCRRPARLRRLPSAGGRATERLGFAGRRLPFSPWHLLLAPVAFVFALPLIWMILSSFMSNAQINQFPPTIIPDSLHVDGWSTVLGDSEFPRWFLNSTIVARGHRRLQPRLLLARRLRLRPPPLPRLDGCSSC